ncbi:MAG: hypothetical protein C4K47_06930 [Candidatus Thorarchaeota archaeon]|nr:MAG: hypothetical protein C4K47_06930 [Candidatus Thorarchaeota archaeon]
MELFRQILETEGVSIHPEIAYPVLMEPTVHRTSTANETVSLRRRFDKKILLVFALLASISILIPCASYFLVEDFSGFEVVSAIVGGLTVSFLIVGIPIYVHYRSSGIVSRRGILRWMAVFSACATTIIVIFIGIAAVYYPDLVQLGIFTAGELVVAGVAIVIALFVVFLFFCLALYLAAIGAVGVLSAIERLFTPRVMKEVARLSGNIKLSLIDRAIRWLFDIPDVLDTKTLSLSPTESRRGITLSDLRAPVFWQLLFGFVMGIYVSFNPFVSDRSPAALLNLFSLLTTASLLFPFLILPWFLLRKLGASISGQAKQFTLYNGLRSRMFQSYFAVGTLFILVRVSVQEIAVAFEVYVVAFATFMLVLLGSALLSTFVYLNYFENALAEDIAKDLEGTEVRVIAREPIG